MLGQAALSGKGTILDNLPDGFLRIEAGVGAGRPTALINDILDLSKIESGRAEVVNEGVSVPQLLEVLERSFRPVAVDRGLELRVHASADCPDRIITDGRRLEQILSSTSVRPSAIVPWGSFTRRWSAEASWGSAPNAVARRRYWPMTSPSPSWT